MKTVLKHTAIALALAFGAVATLTSQATQAETTKVEYASEMRQLPAFKAIELSGPYHVVIKGQGAQSVQVSGDKSRLADIETVVQGDTLIVRPVQRNSTHFFFGIGKKREQMTVTITAAILHSLKNSGSGDVELEQASADQFKLTNEGSGDIVAAGTVGTLTLASRGSGDLDLRRLAATKAAAVAMHGSGDAMLANLAGPLTLEMHGSGDFEGDSLRLARVTARLRGSGSAILAGSGADLDVEVRGSGDFDACRLPVANALAVLHGSGSGCIAGPSKKFDGEVHGSGDLDVRNLKAESTRLLLHSSGQARLDGSTVLLNADISGSGELEAGKLTSKNATVRTRGPGQIELATVSDTLDAELRGSGGMRATIAGKRLLLKMSGPGEADIDGTVDAVSAQISGSGSLEGRSLVALKADVAVRGPGNAVVNVKGDAKAANAGQPRLVTIDRRGTHNGDY